MNTVQRILKNVVVSYGGQLLGYAIAFSYMMVTARFLGPSSFGVLSFSLAFTAIFSIFADFGLQPLTTREVARDKTIAPKYLANLGVMKMILAAGTFGLIAITINLLGYPQQTIRVVYLVALSAMLNSFTAGLYSIFQAHERMEYQSLGQILNSVLMLSGVILAIKLGVNVVSFAFLYFLSSVFCLIYGFAVLKARFSNLFLKWSQQKIEVDWGFWKNTLRQAFPFGLGMFFVMIYYWIDSVMLSLMKGDAVVGWYNVAYRMVLVLLFIPRAFIAAIYPVTSRFYRTSRSSLELSLEASFKYLTVIGVPIGVGTTLLAKRLVFLIFGPEYGNSILPLQILIWSSVLIFMDQPFGNLLNSINKQIIITKITGICVGVNIILNLILIPKYSLIGASIATFLTQFTGSLLIFAYSSKIGYSIFKKDFVSITIRVLISSVFMGVFILYFHGLGVLALVALATVLYFTTLYVIRGITKEDSALIRRVLERN